MKPEYKKRYPKNWASISLFVRFNRAKGVCENCGAEHGKANPETGSTVVLTTAHLDHTPENCELSNLKALCQCCHLRYDGKQHARTRRQNRLKGQLKLENCLNYDLFDSMIPMIFLNRDYERKKMYMLDNFLSARERKN